MTIGEKIRSARKRAGLTQKKLGEALGVRNTTISNWEKGVAKPDTTQIELLSGHLNVAPAYFFDQRVVSCSNSRTRELPRSEPAIPPGIEEYKPDRYIPVLGRVAAGIPIFAAENIEEYIPCDYHDDYEYFSLRAQGDSMTAVGIGDGDCIIVRRQDIVDNGDVAVVLVNGDEATVKKFTQKDKMVVLTPQSHNPMHQAQVYDITDVPIRVLGKVIEVRHKFL